MSWITSQCSISSFSFFSFCYFFIFEGVIIPNSTGWTSKYVACYCRGDDEHGYLSIARHDPSWSWSSWWWWAWYELSLDLCYLIANYDHVECEHECGTSMNYDHFWFVWSGLVIAFVVIWLPMYMVSLFSFLDLCYLIANYYHVDLNKLKQSA